MLVTAHLEYGTKTDATFGMILLGKK